MNSNLRLLVGSSSIVAVTVSLALWLISGPGSTLGWVKSVALVLVLSAGSAALLGQLVRHLAAERLNQLISHLQAIDRDGDYRLRSQLAGSDEVAQAAAHLDSIFARVLQQLSDVALERSKLEARLEACELRLVKEVE